MNLPTWITFSRLMGIPFIIYLLIEPNNKARWIAFAIFIIASCTDWLDGYLARKLNQVTELGKFLDPLVDKLLVLAPLLSLIELQQIPAWGVFIILLRELTIAGWRINPNLSGNKTIQGANIWGKLKTLTQITAISFLIAPINGIWQDIGLIIFWLSVILTVISGIIYLVPISNINQETIES